MKHSRETTDQICGWCDGPLDKQSLGCLQLGLQFSWTFYDLIWKRRYQGRSEDVGKILLIVIQRWCSRIDFAWTFTVERRRAASAQDFSWTSVRQVLETWTISVSPPPKARSYPTVLWKTPSTNSPTPKKRVLVRQSLAARIGLNGEIIEARDQMWLIFQCLQSVRLDNWSRCILIFLLFWLVSDWT